MSRLVHTTRDHQPYLAPEELAAALAVCNVRDRALFYTMFELALRAGEPGMLRRDAWNPKRREIKVLRLKGSISATRGTTAALDSILRAWDEVRPASTWLFPGRDPVGPRGLARDSVRDLWRRAAERAQLSPRAAYVHILKHTRGTLLSSAGVKREAIAEEMGHKMATSTDRYLKVTEADRAKAQSATENIASLVLGSGENSEDSDKDGRNQGGKHR